MGLGPRLELRQSQQLVMTPQMQQAIQLLTLTNIELESFIAVALEKNPLLSTETGEPSPDAEAPPVLPEPPADSDRLDQLLAREPALALAEDPLELPAPEAEGLDGSPLATSLNTDRSSAKAPTAPISSG